MSDQQPEMPATHEPPPAGRFARVRAQLAVVLSKPFLPEITGVVIAAGAGAWWLLHSMGGVLPGTNYVVFDPVKLGNAERAVAARLLGSNSDSEAGLLLAKVGKQTEPVIRDVAHGAVVLVKQAVVLSDYPDITDEVLVRLGLPTDVPTIASAMFSSDVAPTQHAAEADRSADKANALADFFARGRANAQADAGKELLP